MQIRQNSIISSSAKDVLAAGRNGAEGDAAKAPANKMFKLCPDD